MINKLNTEKLDQGSYVLSGTVLRRKDSIKSRQSLLIFFKEIGPRWVFSASPKEKNGLNGVEPLVWGIFHIYQSPKSITLKSCDIKADFLTIRQAPAKLMTAIEIYALLNKHVYLDHEDDETLQLLWNAMLQIEQTQEMDLVVYRFVWRLLNRVGNAPALTHCSKCGATLKNEPVGWSPDGLLCPKCASIQELTANDLYQMQCAVGLAHNEFISWTKKNHATRNIKKITKKMLTFFNIA